MIERQLGIKAFHEGRLREAADRLRAAAADDERTVSQATGFQTYAYLGAAVYALGDAAGAAEIFSSAVTLHMGTAPPLDLMINLANAYLASGRRQQAEQTLTRTLQDNPGAMEARLLLERLQSRDESLPLTGSVFGESPESVQHYMDTLSFSSATQGYSPDEVRAALTQIHHYIGTLSNQLVERDQEISEQVAEIERLRQTEESLIDNMVQVRQELDRLRSSSNKQTAASRSGDDGQDSTAEASDDSSLTPLEKLFQKKS